MTHDNDPKLHSLSRRKMLAGLGAVGFASAGAGLGTSAFFSDQENFENNSLMAGELDMLVDWEEHYYDGSDGRDLVEYVPQDEIDILEDDQYILPAVETPDARPIALRFLGDGTFQENKDAFFEATSIEALPDSDDDGIQDDFSDDQVCSGEAGLTNVGNPDAEERGEGLYAPNRTSNDVTAPGDPLINLGDVKPGDFGEVTFSFHLCDNPGYVWMNGMLNEEFTSEGVLTEPERNDPDEIDGVVELLDEVEVRMWYDPDCDNQVERRGEVDIMLAIDTSGSIRADEDGVDEQQALIDGVEAFVDALPTGGSAQVGAIGFGDGGVTGLSGLGTPDSFSLPSLSFNGNTPMPGAIDIADQVLDDQGRADALPVVVVVTDGGPNYGESVTDPSYTATFNGDSYSAPRGAGFSADDSSSGYDNNDSASGTVTEGEQDETALVADAVKAGADGSRIAVLNIAPGTVELGGGRDLSDYLEDEIASAGFYNEIPVSNFADVADDIAAEVVVQEEVFFNGNLRTALDALSGNEGRGVPLDGDRATSFDELADPENDPDRDPFTGAGVTHCVGFQWWLPVDHANQIQGDTVGFDIGFYTEQSRHNDGTGMVPEDETPAAPINDSA